MSHESINSLTNMSDINATDQLVKELGAINATLRKLCHILEASAELQLRNGKYVKEEKQPCL